MNSYILSVIVPTKNREIYANKTIRQIMQTCGNAVEVVVQDNGTSDTLEKLLEDIKDRRNLIYHHTYEVLSFVDNFNQALQLATGEYVIIIGDDDGVTSELLKIAMWAKKNNIDIIKPNLNIIYFWPGSKVFPEEKDMGTLKISSSTQKISYSSASLEVNKLLKNSCQDYLKYDLVKIYHGLVKRDLVGRIKEKTGRYIGGLSPDIYLSVSLSLVADKPVVSVDVPLTISGICGGSGSSQSSTGEHTGKLQDAPHFRGHKSYEWSKNVPAFYSVETIWADSALAAIKDIAPERMNGFRMEKLLHSCIKKYPEYKDIALKNYKSSGGNRMLYNLWKGREIIRRVKNSVRYRMQKHVVKEWEHIEDIFQASDVCEKYLSSLYSSFEEICDAAKITKL